MKEERLADFYVACASRIVSLGLPNTPRSGRLYEANCVRIVRIFYASRIVRAHLAVQTSRRFRDCSQQDMRAEMAGDADPQNRRTTGCPRPAHRSNQDSPATQVADREPRWMCRSWRALTHPKPSPHSSPHSTARGSVLPPLSRCSTVLGESPFRRLKVRWNFAPTCYAPRPRSIA